MKFGRLLRTTAEDLPEMESLFVSYKQLKKQLKRLPYKDQMTEHEAVQTLTEEENNFVHALSNTVNEVNQRFLDKEENSIIRVERLESQLASASTPEQLNELHKEFVDFHGEVLLLLHWSILAYTATVKILKKHHKRTGLLVRAPQLGDLLSQPFCSTELMTSIAHRVEEDIQSLSARTGLVPPTSLITDPTGLAGSCSHIEQQLPPGVDLALLERLSSESFSANSSGEGDDSQVRAEAGVEEGSPYSAITSSRSPAAAAAAGGTSGPAGIKRSAEEDVEAGEQQQQQQEQPEKGWPKKQRMRVCEPKGQQEQKVDREELGLPGVVHQQQQQQQQVGMVCQRSPILAAAAQTGSYHLQQQQQQQEEVVVGPGGGQGSSCAAPGAAAAAVALEHGTCTSFSSRTLVPVAVAAAAAPAVVASAPELSAPAAAAPGPSARGAAAGAELAQEGSPAGAGARTAAASLSAAAARTRAGPAAAWCGTSSRNEQEQQQQSGTMEGGPSAAAAGAAASTPPPAGGPGAAGHSCRRQGSIMRQTQVALTTWAHLKTHASTPSTVFSHSPVPADARVACTESSTA